MAAQSFSIKATHAATRDVRRATMQEESIDSLQEKLKALFNASQPFDLLYKDDEGDLVRFSSNEELNEALRVCAQTRVLHLVVCEEGQKPIEATAPPVPAFCPPHLMHHGPGPWMMRKAWMREDGPMGRACHGPRVFPGWRHGADGAKFFAAKLKAKAEALRAAVSTMDPKAPHRHHLADKLARVEMRLQTLEGQTANVSAEHQSAEHSAEACREDCGFRVHSNERVGGGTHCCRACKAGKGHGPACEQVAAEPACEGEGCDFPVHPNMKIGGGTHCCGRCKAGKGHGPHCKGARSPVTGAAPAAKAEAKAKGGLKTTSLLATKDKLEAKLADPALKPHRRAKITDKIATLEAKLAENGDVEGAPQEGSNGLMNKPLAARFVTDVTLPKGSTVESGALFSKTWRMRNVGTEPWPASTRLVMVGRDSDAMGAESEHPVPAAAPGDSVDITVEFVAPVDAGRYSSYWRLAHGEGQKFGQRVWLEVEVVSSSSSSSSSDYPLPSDDSADSDTCVIPAPAPSATFEADVATIVAMGFEPTLVRKVLGRCKGDLGRAVEKLVRKTQKAVRRADKVSEKKAKEHKRR